MPKKYTKGHVGIMRHPEIYQFEHPKVFDTVEEELAMWKCAEKMFKLIEKGKFTRGQMMFIMHYVMCMNNMSDADMYQAHAFMQFKISQSVAGQHMREIVGNSAKQLAKTKSWLRDIRDDKEVEFEVDEEKPKNWLDYTAILSWKAWLIMTGIGSVVAALIGFAFGIH